VLNLRARVTGSAPCERDVRGRLFAFYDWCAQNDDIPELLSLAKTISRWETEIITGQTAAITHHKYMDTASDRQETRSRLTSKSRISCTKYSYALPFWFNPVSHPEVIR
jgi:hypothetical protein